MYIRKNSVFGLFVCRSLYPSACLPVCLSVFKIYISFDQPAELVDAHVRNMNPTHCYKVFPNSLSTKPKFIKHDEKDDDDDDDDDDNDDDAIRQETPPHCYEKPFL